MKAARALGLLLIAGCLAVGALWVADSLSAPNTGTVNGVLEVSFIGETPISGVVTFARLATGRSVTVPTGPHGRLNYPILPGTWIPIGDDGKTATFSPVEASGARSFSVGSNGTFSVSIAPGAWSVTGGRSKSREFCHGGFVDVRVGQQSSTHVECPER